MPIGTTPAYNGPYTANGATTVFPFTFKVLSTSQVSVVLRVDGSDTTVSSGLYTVTLSGSSPSSGSVVFNTAPASGEVYVLLSPEFSQDIEFADGAAWIAKPVNDGYDQSALRDQALKRDLGRAMLVPVGETTPVLPVASERAGQYLAYDTNGDPVMASGTGADAGLRTDLANTAAGKGAALVGVEGGGTVQSVADGFKRRLSLGSMGVDNSTDATAAIQSLFADAQDGDHIVIDRDVTYTATTGVTLARNDVTLEWTERGHISAPNIDNAANAAFMAIVGTQIGTLTPAAGDLIAGKYFIDVATTAGVQVDDLICIKTSVYFNGLTSVTGWDVINQQEWLRVRAVEATRLRFTNALRFDTPNASISSIEIHRPVRNVRVINPRMTGPGLNGATITNGNGARGFFIGRVLNFNSVGGYMSGWPGYCFQIARFENANVHGLVMDSGEAALTTQAFYGVVHEGGRGGRVSNCVGRNIRRVADTGGAASAINGVLAQEIQHIDIRGEMMNGSVAGTHHCFGYYARNITGVACPTVMTIRSKDNDIQGVRGVNIAGQLILTGPGLEYSEEAASVGRTRIHGMELEGTVDGAVRGSAFVIYGNGEYDLEGNLLGHDGVGIHIRAEYIDGLRVRGKVIGSPTAFATTNLLNIRGKRLRRVDIQGVEFGNATIADILLNGTSDPASPAELIVVRDCVSNSSLTSQYQFNPAGTPGFIKGETVWIDNNTASAGSGTQPVSIGSPTYWTAQPTLQGNRKVYDGSAGFSTFSRGDNAPVCVGRFANAAAIPSGTTVLAGDWFEVANPGAGNYAENQVTFAGTVGTIAGVTGGITATQAILTMIGNDATKVGLGSIITVAGSGVSVYRVIEISADYTTATLNTPAVTTVAGAAVQYRAPTFKGRNLVQV